MRSYAPISMRGDDDHGDDESNHNGNGHALRQALQAFQSPNKLSPSSATSTTTTSAPIPIPIQASPGGGAAPLPSVYNMSGDEVRS